jgi:hypothetical protein
MKWPKYRPVVLVSEGVDVIDGGVTAGGGPRLA